ncbi:Crp/Fnr family transcriptional regulator [Paracrocinitomix mangrovi]|uniref:Crp/Fnr family transcriptional regulator n=1 Tax=Paracrocinitomix mangrovi TaxID=2862509 RepID=UPI001C8E0DEF|nr:Crp/Fnr family transcriptional regulator [Paracrocinitomix mangrovi]UKN01860.1 Crp/Fnr family transcriptional regulator [Paracrocinitomix mangrovi]
MSNIVEELTKTFPEFSTELKSEIVKQGRLMHLKAGEVLMSIGGEFRTIPLITSGAIKVMREDEDGRELFLYYLRPGQTCAMSLNCFMLSKPSEVYAVAEEETTIIALKAENIGSWLEKFPDWRAFVIGTFQLRFHEMLSTIDGIAFRQLDARLLEFLKEKAAVMGTKTIITTHQDLADHLNSTREVISRLLKILEKKGEIELGRNKITLV